MQLWRHSTYGNTREVLPLDAPKPLGKAVTLTHYVDANLFHDWVSGKSVTGVLHFINQTPLEWYTKKQSTVETATYGSEFLAARTCIEQIMDLRNYLRYLGVPIDTHSYMFGDNKAVVDSSTRLDAKLHKRHVALSFHFVRSAIASGMVYFFHIYGPINPADILSKHWAYSAVWYVMQPILFWEGDTAAIPRSTLRSPPPPLRVDERRPKGKVQPLSAPKARPLPTVKPKTDLPDRLPATSIGE
jgi:hypothetical protein